VGVGLLRSASGASLATFRLGPELTLHLNPLLTTKVNPVFQVFARGSFAIGHDEVFSHQAQLGLRVLFDVWQ
jgi:hypothetical protein